VTFGMFLKICMANWTRDVFSD